MKHVLAILSALVLLTMAAPLAHAETGTPAWSIRPLVLFQGPGTEYQLVGEIGAEARIRVDRCSRLWCHVRSGHASGWAWLRDIAFGNIIADFRTGPRMMYKRGGPGVVCLYEGRNFTGAALCAESGFRIRDLLLLGADNRFSSVTVDGDVSVMLCRDRDYTSYCERFNNSEGSLHGFLDNNVTSVRVY